MNTNTKKAICARCRKPVAPGTGRFCGPGIVVHKNPCQKPTWVTPNKKKMIAFANKFLAP